MASGVIFKLEGLRDFQAQIEAGGKAVADAVSRVQQETARTISNRAKSLAPRDRGDLQAAISFAGKGLNWRVGIDDRSIPSRGGSSSHQHPSVYAVFLEFGTRHMSARPFMRPAADAEQATYPQDVETAIAAALKS